MKKSNLLIGLKVQDPKKVCIYKIEILEVRIIIYLYLLFSFIVEKLMSLEVFHLSNIIIDTKVR